MNRNPYQSPEKAESNEAVSELPVGLIAFQGIMTLGAILMYIVWIPYLKNAYEEFGVDLSVLTRHLMNNFSAYMTAGVLIANGLFVGMLANRKRGRLKNSRRWAVFFVVFWILFLVYSALIAYSPVFSIRNGGVDIWL